MMPLSFSVSKVKKNIKGEKMREEVISSGGTIDPTPVASLDGASSPALPTNPGSIDWLGHGHSSKSCVGSQPPWTSLSTNAGGSTIGISRSSCRPWEREDLIRRLSTFKPSNWFGKPKAASSLACAQRGWINIDTDKIVCESCGACLSSVSLSSHTPAEAESAGEAFAKQLDAEHKITCPWRGNSCPESLVQFPPTPQSALIGGYKDRCDGLLQFQSLPVVPASAIGLMRVSRGTQIDRFLTQSNNFTAGDVDFKAENIPELEASQDGALSSYFHAQRLISLCGWEPRWLPNVQDCEEHSAQSARDGYSFGSTHAQLHLSQNPGTSKNAPSSSARRDTGKNKVLVESRCESRSPLLDCSLCGATVKILNYLTVPRPARFSSDNLDIPNTSKNLGLTRGVNAASGISGWVAVDDAEKEQTEGRDEVATTNGGKLLENAQVDLNLTMAGGLSLMEMGRTGTSDNIHGTDLGKELMTGQPAGSEVGDRATSYESRGPSSRKRSIEIGGSSDDRPHSRIQQADSVEGTVIDRDGDEVTDEKRYSAGPSKRTRDSDVFDTYCSPYQRDSSGAGPSHSMGYEMHGGGNRVASFVQGRDQMIGNPSARESTQASSVIAMDTICHSPNDDSMDSVENYPGDVDDVNFLSSSTYGNLDLKETSELNYSYQAQQSICFHPTPQVGLAEIGVCSTNDGGGIFNTDTVTAQARDGFSFGISGGSVGMCPSHEASIHRTHSVGDVEPRTEEAENQGQTGESAPDPGLMDEIVPGAINREDPRGDSQEMLSQSVGRADSGAKIDGSVKAESVESGEKISQSCKLVQDSTAHPSHSCNAVMYSGHEKTRKVVSRAGKSSSINNCAYQEESHFATANDIGPPKEESNYEEALEFDPIVHHNQFCPWVNCNVAAAGCIGSGSSTSSDDFALCGWQLTLDALDALRSLGSTQIPIGHSESAASLYKDDDKGDEEKLLQHHSMSRSHGKH